MDAQFKEFKITTKGLFDKYAPWENSWNKNNHIVTVKNTHTGKRTKFEFWCSCAHPEFRTEYDVLNALYCFVTDSIAGMQNFWDFCDEFGYEPNRKSAEVHEECKRAYRNVKRVSEYTDNEICDFANELGEIAS